MLPNTEEIILRESLFRSLDENSSKKVIALIAPAGYGKTTLVSSYLLNRKQPFVWLGITARHNTFFTFIEQLINSFSTIKPGFGSKLLTSVSAAKQSNELNKKIDDIAGDLSDLFTVEFTSSFKSKLIMVIDDFHILDPVENNAAIIFIENLIRSQTSSLSIIITSRTELPISLNILKAKREVYVLTSNELRFTRQETSELTAKVYPDSSGKEIIDNLEKLLNGWITGIHLVLQTGLKNTFDNDNLKNVINESLYGFFIEEVWNRLDVPIKDFLLKTSHLSSFTPKLCSDIYGFTNAPEVIDYLIRRNIFITKKSVTISTQTETVFSYTDYFKQFLQTQYSKSDSEENQALNKKTIAEYYLKNREYENAIVYFTDSGCFSEALQVIADNFNEDSQLETLKLIGDSLQKIPEEMLIRYPAAIYLKALSAIYHDSDITKTLSLINTVIEIIEDPVFKIKFTLLKAELMFTPLELASICAELDALTVTDNESKLLVKLNYVYGKILYRTGSANFDNAKSKLETALKLSDELEENTLKPVIYMYLGNLCQDFGEFEKSFFYRKRSAEASKNIYQKMQVYNNLCGLQVHVGKYEVAYETLNQMSALFEKYPLRLLKRFLLKAEANFYYECGDHDACIERYEEIIRIEDSLNLTDFMCYNYLMEGLQHYYANCPEYGLQRFDIAESFILTGKEYDKLLVNQGRALCSLRLSPVKEKESIEKYLMAIYEYYKKNNLHVVAAQVSFYLASLYLRNDQYETSLAHLETALAPAQEKELISFLERELPLQQDVMDFAVSNNINKPLIRLIYEKYLGRGTFPWHSEKCRERISADTAKLTDIRFLPFGTTGLYLRGKPILDDKWIRKKSKILLAYLMSSPEKIHTKDKIMDLFFDDAPADKADMVYHSTLYNIRTALKIYDIKSDKPKRSKDKTFDYNPQYILYEDKTLRLNPDFYYRSDNIEFEKHYDKSRLPSLSNEEKITHSVKAARLYKGDFLPGYYDSWAEELRIKYKNMYISLLEELVKLLESEDRYEEAVKYSELLLSEDKLNDSIHVSIINAYQKLGNANMAKSRFELMLKIYDEELGEKPYPKTLEKINHILCAAKNL
jgi:DNA-binding SARP family transcriptional activator